MTHSTTILPNPNSPSLNRVQATHAHVRNAIIRLGGLLLVVFVVGLESRFAHAQTQIGRFGYSDSWASYSPSSFPPFNSGGPMLTAPVAVPGTFPVQSTLGSGTTGCAETSMCGCDTCPCDESCRHFAIDVSSVFFRRNRLDARRLFFNPTADSEQIDASQFDIGFTSGIEAGIIAYHQPSLTDFEFRSIWLSDWSSGVNRNFTGGTVQVNATPPLATAGPRTAFASYNSEFWSAEFNARYRLRSRAGTTLLAGFRAMRLDDKLTSRLEAPTAAVPDELIESITRNRLFGFQIGADYVVRNCSNWCLRLKGRVGMYGNAGSQKSSLVSLAAPPVIFPASGNSSDLAFHAELGTEAKLRLSSYANVLLGYRVMTLDGLAIATEQLDGINFLDQSGYQSNGLVVMQAINVGIEFVY